MNFFHLSFRGQKRVVKCFIFRSIHTWWSKLASMIQQVRISLQGSMEQLIICLKITWTLNILVLVYFIVINHNVILPDDTNYLHNMFIFCSTQPGLELSSLWIIPLCSHRSIFPLSSITYLHKFMQTMEHWRTVLESNEEPWKTYKLPCHIWIVW